MEEDHCVISKNCYGIYAIPKSTLHRPAAQFVNNGKVWEPETIEFMRNVNRGGDVVHAGTFFGDFLPGLSDGMKGRGMVWAFEPVPNNFTAARKTIAMNGLENVVLRNAALSERPSTLHMAVADQDRRPLGGGSRVVGIQSELTVSVDAVPIDAAVPETRRVSIIQLDVEGHERQALLGARKTIRRCRPVLILEGFNDVSWLNSHVGPYRFVGKLHDNSVFATVPD